MAIILKGKTYVQWEQLKKTWERQGKTRINDWDKMKKKMREHFFPFGYSQTLYQRIYTLKQGGKSVNDYSDEFYRLVSRNDLPKTEEQLMARYFSSLRQSIQDVLCLQAYWTALKVYKRALMVEKQQATRTVSKRFRGEQNYRRRNSDLRQTTNYTRSNP